MKNYINKTTVLSFLTKCKTIEYWLGFDAEQQFQTCRWIAVEEGREEKGRYYVIYHNVFNDIDEGVESVYDFSYVEPDEIYGKILKHFSTPIEALDFCLENFNVNLNKFVPEGYIDDFIFKKDKGNK